MTEINHMKEDRDIFSDMDILSKFTSEIAHDFNNILGGLFGFLELARYSTTEPDVKEYLEQAILNIDRARVFTEKLSFLSKVRDMNLERVDLSEIIRKSAKGILGGTNIDIKDLLPPKPILCDLDEKLVSRAFDNLFRNSKFALPHGGKIGIFAEFFTLKEGQHSFLSEGNYVKIFLSDNGPGIDEQNRGKLFKPFFKTSKDGDGMGLAMAYFIIRNHKGSIFLRSNCINGACFGIILPIFD